MRHLPTVIVTSLIPMYVLGVFVSDVFAPTAEQETPKEESFTISFVGDMMFDRYIRERAALTGYDVILSDTAPLFENSDLIIGNLEGPISALAPVADWRDSGPNHYKFTFATSVASTLHTFGFSAVNLANNHIMNFGDEGLSQTKYWLGENDVEYLGAPDELYVPWRYTSGSIPIVVYALDSWHTRDVALLLEKISKEQEESFVAVYMHWGDEYDRVPNNGQRELARALVDAGVDLIVGTHPHVIQTKEQYHNAWVYYSLGNFVFDQYFDENVRCGAVLHAHIAKDGTYTVEEDFVSLERNGTTARSQCTMQVPPE